MGSATESHRLTLAYLQQGSDEPGDCKSSPLSQPPWLDVEKFSRGQRFFKDHIFCLVLAMHCSLATGLSIVNLLDPLVFTEKSDTPRKAFNRYTQTFLHLALWHLGRVWDPNDDAHKSTQTVRKMHNHVSQQLTKKQPGKTHLSQYDMALVQSGFMGAATMYPYGFGIRCSKQDLEDYIHFWRGIGYLLGIDDKYNMCSRNYEETFNISQEIETNLLLPSLDNPPKDYARMVDAYVKGTNIPSGFQFMSIGALVAFCYYASSKTVPAIGFVDCLRLWILKFLVIMVRWCPGFEYFMNYSLLMYYKKMKHILDVNGKKYI